MRKIKVKYIIIFTVHARNDIALLIMKKPFEFKDAPHMGIGCLGTRLPAAGTTCYGMGWGEEVNNNKAYAVVLKKV